VFAAWCQQQRIFPARWGEFWDIIACRNAIRQDASKYWRRVAASFVAELKRSQHCDSECMEPKKRLRVKQKKGHNSRTQ
jgi:hypothetical protein